MIDGITVLNNVTVRDFNLVPWLWVLIGFLVVFIVIYVFDKYNRQDTLCWWGIAFIAVLMLFILDIRCSQVDAIQCTIEDNVSINEVYDNYDVIDKQGEIWTLKEKTNENT